METIKTWEDRVAPAWVNQVKSNGYGVVEGAMMAENADLRAALAKQAEAAPVGADEDALARLHATLLVTIKSSVCCTADFAEKMATKISESLSVSYMTMVERTSSYPYPDYGFGITQPPQPEDLVKGNTVDNWSLQDLTSYMPGNEHLDGPKPNIEGLTSKGGWTFTVKNCSIRRANTNDKPLFELQQGGMLHVYLDGWDIVKKGTDIGRDAVPALTLKNVLAVFEQQTNKHAMEKFSDTFGRIAMAIVDKFATQQGEKGGA